MSIIKLALNDLMVLRALWITESELTEIGFIPGDAYGCKIYACKRKGHTCMLGIHSTIYGCKEPQFSRVVIRLPLPGQIGDDGVVKERHNYPLRHYKSRLPQIRNHRIREHDAIEKEILEAIISGEKPPTGTNDKIVTNALSRLRRNKFIINQGTRAHPQWALINKEP